MPDVSSAGNRLAVDIGGTFTDLVLDWHDTRFTHKRLTTHADPAEAVIAGVQQLLAQSGARAADLDLVLHGTTLATNALIERRGANTALFTTAGHRDVLAMASENRFEQYDINIDRPQPLVPRHLRLPIVERMAADGAVLLPLDEQSIHRAISVAQDAGVTSVAIGLLHSYANPVHEEQVASLLQSAWPSVSVTLSSAVCPEIREFERFSTAAANAYVKPLMADYLAELERALQALGLTAPILLMTSGGGLTQLATAREFPIRLVESGPAGGAALAARLAATHGATDVLSFDMGGTTAKLCLIDNHEPLLSRAFEVDRQYRFKKGSGLPVRIPVIEMVEIGAGGGSIAQVDALERIQVGPLSAGSEPGPACYDQGGQLPTVTDADLFLGKIPGAALGDGAMPLNVAAAKRALQAELGEQLDLSAADAAFGISAVVDENMASACRAHAAEWGKGVTNRLLIAFGGAAPLHAVRLAQILRLTSVLIPSNAGVGSAIGFLVAPVRYEVVRSRFGRLSDFAPLIVAPLIEAMRHEASAVVLPVLAAASDTRLPVEQLTCYMRYAGQGYEIAVPVVDGQLQAELLRSAFEETYTRLYGRTIAGQEVEILSWTLSLSSAAQDITQLPRPTMRQLELNTKNSVASNRSEIPEYAQYQRRELQLGDSLKGPALIAESHTTTVIPAGAVLSVLADGALFIELKAGNP